MKLLIAIPSKNRVEILEKNTWAWAKDIKNYDVKIFVEPQDYEAYKVFGEENLITLDDNNQGLGYAKRFIQSYAEQNGYDVIFKLDDDTKTFTKFRKSCKVSEMPEHIQNVLCEILDVFEKGNVGAVAFPYRFHLFEKEKWKVVKKLQSSYLVRTELIHSGFDFHQYEDIATALYCLVKGFKVLKYCHSGQDQGVDVGKGTGGYQSFDRGRMEIVEKEAEQLRKMYPPLTFRKVDKPWKIEPDVKSIKL